MTLAAALLPLVPALVGGDLGLFETVQNYGRLPDPTAVLHLPTLLAIFLGILLFLFLASHALSTMIRSRSAWLAADLAAALSLIGIGCYLLWDLRLHLMMPPLMAGAALLSTAWIGGLVAGAAVQCARGRTDPVRAHRALSLVLWGSVALGTAVLLGLHGWALHPSYDSLVGEPIMSTSATGRWVTVTGAVKGRGNEAEALFLGRSGEGKPRLVGWGTGFNEVRFSPDERWAVLIILERRPVPGFVARLLPLDPPGPPRETDLRFGARWPQVFFSEDSRSLLVLVDDEARLLSFPSLDQTGSVKLPRDSGTAFSGGRFLADGSLLLCSWGTDTGSGGRTGLLLWSWDPRTRRFQRRAFLVDAAQHSYWLSPSGDRILYQTTAGAGRALRFADCATGRILAEPLSGADSIRAAFLRDGRFVVSDRRDGTKRSLRLFDTAGLPLTSLDVPAERWMIPGGEVAPGKVAVFGNFKGRPLAAADAYVYDADANSLTPMTGLHPGWQVLFAVEERLAPPPPDRAAWRRLFTDDRGRFVLHDFASGRDEPVVGAPGS